MRRFKSSGHKILKTLEIRKFRKALTLAEVAVLIGLMGADKKAIGFRIRELRYRVLKTNQADLGEALGGLKKSMISAYETGDSSPSPETLAQIAELAGVTLDWLIAGKGPMRAAEVGEAAEREDLTDRERRLLRLFRALPSVRQDRLLEVAVDEHLAYMEEKNM